jgi:hypothetical protein
MPKLRVTANRWNSALKAKCYDKVAALYSTQDLSFLPTVSSKFIRDSSSAKEYFMEFLQKLPEGNITSDTVQPFGNDAYLHTGLYTYMVGPDDGRRPVEARFSFMWRIACGRSRTTTRQRCPRPKAQKRSSCQAKSCTPLHRRTSRSECTA